MKHFLFGGMDFLKDLFASVNNRVNGFERALKTGRYRGDGYLIRSATPTSRAQYSGTRSRGSTYFPPEKRNGAQECARRVRQMQRAQANQQAQS